MQIAPKIAHEILKVNKLSDFLKIFVDLTIFELFEEFPKDFPEISYDLLAGEGFQGLFRTFPIFFGISKKLRTSFDFQDCWNF